MSSLSALRSHVAARPGTQRLQEALSVPGAEVTATAGSPLSGSPLSLPTLSYPAAYKQPIDFNNDPRYATFTRTDFSWAIPSNAFAPAAAPVAPEAQK